MRRSLIRTLLAALLLVAAAEVAAAQTCVRIDEGYDTLTPDERTAAVLIMKKTLVSAGQSVDARDCQSTYTLSHIRLGRTILVTLAGPQGSREGQALGLDDLPAIYSQLVRSLLTGHPMGSLAVLDRGNVSEAQDRAPRRVQSDGYWHARIGAAALFGPTVEPMAAFGFGYRAAFDHYGVDMSFLNFAMSDSSSYDAPRGASGSLIRLEGLRFITPAANRSAYVGGGLSYGWTSLSRPSGLGYPTTGRGSGLRGELTVGYEIARVTAARLFVQADVTLPFYNVAFDTFTYPTGSSRTSGPPTVTTERRYAPSIALTVGLGWQRGRR